MRTRQGTRGSLLSACSSYQGMCTSAFWLLLVRLGSPPRAVSDAFAEARARSTHAIRSGLGRRGGHQGSLFVGADVRCAASSCLAHLIISTGNLACALCVSLKKCKQPHRSDFSALKHRINTLVWEHCFAFFSAIQITLFLTMLMLSLRCRADVLRRRKKKSRSLFSWYFLKIYFSKYQDFHKKSHYTWRNFASVILLNPSILHTSTLSTFSHSGGYIIMQFNTLIINMSVDEP